MSDDSLLKTPGELIGEMRQARSLTLDDLSTRTKIPPPMLRALEADEYHRISGPLYIKSFLRTCATELGIDVDDILAAYGRFSGEVRTGTGEPVWEEENVQISRIGFPWLRLLSWGVGGAVLVTALVVFIGRGCEKSPETAGPVNPQPTAVVESSGAEADTAGLTAAATPPPRRDPPPVETAKPRSDLPVAAAGDPTLEFSGGRRWPVVLRLVSADPVNVRLQRDGEGSYLRAVWPATGSTAPPLPADGVEPGRAYGVREGMAVYWGAADHFSLSAEPVAGLKVTINGGVRDVSGLLPGEVVILDLYAAARR